MVWIFKSRAVYLTAKLFAPNIYIHLSQSDKYSNIPLTKIGGGGLDLCTSVLVSTTSVSSRLNLFGDAKMDLVFLVDSVV